MWRIAACLLAGCDGVFGLSYVYGDPVGWCGQDPDGKRGADVASIATDQVFFDDGVTAIGFDLDHGGGIVNMFPGLLDEVRIYDRALAPAEIAMLAQP